MLYVNLCSAVLSLLGTDNTGLNAPTSLDMLNIKVCLYILPSHNGCYFAQQQEAAAETYVETSLTVGHERGCIHLKVTC